ncbi:unnamed protein product, partial [marine sediment metagenome]
INDLSETTISSNRSIIDSYLGMHSSELTAEEIDKLRPQVFKSFSDEKEETAYVKTHEAWTLNSMGNPIFPKEITKGVLYIIRNPLDIAISYSYHNNDTIDETISILNDDFRHIFCEVQYIQRINRSVGMEHLYGVNQPGQVTKMFLRLIHFINKLQSISIVA